MNHFKIGVIVSAPCSKVEEAFDVFIGGSMKKKNIIIGLGATALALGAVAASIGMQLEANPLATYAEEEEVLPQYLYLKVNSNWAKDNAKFSAWFFGGAHTAAFEDFMTSYGDPKDGVYKVKVPGLEDGTAPTQVVFTRHNPSAEAPSWDEGNKWNQTADLDIPLDGKDLYTISEGAWDKGDGVWSKAGEETFTVTFDYGYKAGLDEANYTSTSRVASGEAVTAPANIWRVGYRLDGWLKDGEKFNIEDPLHENVNLVANWIKDESVTGEVGFWITNLNNRVPNTLYSWEEGKDGPIGFPGLPVEVSLSTFSPTMKFSGFEKDKDWVHQLYVISYPKSMDLDYAIFANAHSATEVAWQTVNIHRDGTLAALDMGSNDETGHVKVDARHDVYDALDFLKQAEQARNAVKDKAGYRNYSICGIEPATAKALVAKYDALSKASDGDSNWYAKEYVDATTVWTYSSDSDNEDNIRYGDIVGGLRLLAAKDTLPTLNVDVSNSNVTAAVITFATLGVGMAGVAAYIFTRKKKKFED